MGGRPPKGVKVLCWCQTITVTIPVRKFSSGEVRTRSCGRAGCTEKATADRAEKDRQARLLARARRRDTRRLIG